MFSIYADGVCIYNDVFALENMKAIDPKLTLEDNGAGSLTMTLPPINVGYDTITRMITNISVEKEGEEIWAGRVLSEEKDFWNNLVLYCEGELAFFNDTSQPPAEYSGLSVRGYLEKLVEVHNSKVAANRQFSVGAVTVVDDNFPNYYTNNEKTMALLNALVENYGGHFIIRKVNGTRYLDYMAEYPDTCSQVIQFGSNLIDFTREWDSTEFATVLVPLGKRLDESPIEALDAYLTVESVNKGSMYIQSDEAVAAYGWIEKVVTWSDVDDPEVLQEKAKEYLSELQFDNMEIELNALDLHYLDVSYEAVKFLDEIRVISRPHGLDRMFPVTKMEIQLDSPEKTKFTLGDTVKTSLTSVNNQTNAAILDKIEKLPKAHSLLKEAKENATEIMNRATTGYITITQDEYGSETLYISNIRDYTKADKLWKWNMNGLGYSNDGGETFGLAITMDGAIVADYITAGVLNGDRIRAGVIQDVKGINYWNMETGEFRLSTSAKVGDSTVASLSDITNLDKNLTQKEIFDRLTNNGKAQGIYMVDNQLYINAEYIATGVLRDKDSNVVFDLNKGELTIKKGSINLGNGNFTVDNDGNVYAARGTFAGTLAAAKGTFGGELVAVTGDFKGVVQASDFLDRAGNSMMNNGKFTSGYLDLYGLTIRNILTQETTFAVDSYGAVTINGKVTMGAGSSINWAAVSNTNLSSNPAYSLADSAYSLADYAYDEATAAYERAETAYKKANSITIPSYIKSTYIDSTTVKSPIIEAGEFYGSEFNVITGQSSGSFNMYGAYINSRYHVFTINYYEGDAPTVNLYSPCGGRVILGSSGNDVLFFGRVDFTKAASVTGITATFG